MTLEEKQKLAVQAAEEFWNLDIYDPKHTDKSSDAKRCCKFIDSIIRTPAGLNWTWEHEYTGDNDFAWCGAFVAACYAKAGLKLNIREKDFASTYRLDRYAQADKKGDDKVHETLYEGKYRLYKKIEHSNDIELFGPRPGDILLVGGNGGYGGHITLVERYVPGTLYTIEGNGSGKLPEGEIGNGVVKRVRHIDVDGLGHFRRLIRPALADFE